MTTPSSAHQPPTDVTDEATAEGLRLAQAAGNAYAEMVDYFIANVATSGAKQAAGEYIVGVAAEHAEPLYEVRGGELHLAEPPAGTNAHLEVVVMDGADKRFVPELMVHVTLEDDRGKEVGTYHLPFLWHPTMYHYGRSIHIPADGTYTMRVGIEMPTFGRHDKTNGQRYPAPVVAEFSNIRITTGRK